MTLQDEIKKNEGTIAYWRYEILEPFQSTGETQGYHLEGISDLVRGFGNPPLEIVKKSKKALTALQDLDWRIIREVISETDELIEKLQGAGNTGPTAFLVMIGVRGLVDNQRGYQIGEELKRLRGIKYHGEYVQAYQGIIQVQEEYVAFLKSQL